MDIIVKRGEPKGRSRSRTEEQLIKEGWGGSMSQENLDKCKYLERLAKEQLGADQSHFKQRVIDELVK